MIQLQGIIFIIISKLAFIKGCENYNELLIRNFHLTILNIYLQIKRAIVELTLQQQTNSTQQLLFYYFINTRLRWSRKNVSTQPVKQ